MNYDQLLSDGSVFDAVIPGKWLLQGLVALTRHADANADKQTTRTQDISSKKTESSSKKPGISLQYD